MRLIPENTSKNHFNTIRLAMAILVIWSHCFALFYGNEDHEPISVLFAGNYNAGNIGVRVFFIISGFLITISYLNNKSWITYLQKRVARIFPGYLVATSICAFVIIPLFAKSVDLSAPSVAKVIGLNMVLQGAMPESDVFSTHPVKAVNGALWSIPFEFWCYIGLIGAGLLGLLKRRSIILLAFIGIIAGRVWLDLHGMKPGGGIIGAIIGWPYIWFQIAPCFMAGMLAWLYRESLPRSRALAVALTLALVLSAHYSEHLCGVLFPIVAGYVTFYVGFSTRQCPDAARYGDFSYGTYLYGFPIQQMLIPLAMPFGLYVPATIIASVAAGVASWFLVERFFLSRAKPPKVALAT